jgi:hypothetical protein
VEWVKWESTCLESWGSKFKYQYCRKQPTNQIPCLLWSLLYLPLGYCLNFGSHGYWEP